MRGEATEKTGTSEMVQHLRDVRVRDRTGSSDAVLANRWPFSGMTMWEPPPRGHPNVRLQYSRRYLHARKRGAGECKRDTAQSDDIERCRHNLV